MNTIEVLIIEDNLKVAKAHQLYVERVSGFTVSGVVNFLADAKEMVIALNPDLILLDVYFPDGNGMDFLNELRIKDSDSDVILITAAKDVKLLHDALRGGVFDFMIKPVFFNRFEEALSNYREHYESLKSFTDISQEEVDHFFQHCGSSSSGDKDLDIPKGIDPLTLKKIVAIFNEMTEKKLGAEDVAKMIGASRTTARKYLEYLISTGFLRIDLEYGTIGRPERRYFKV